MDGESGEDGEGVRGPHDHIASVSTDRSTNRPSAGGREAASLGAATPSGVGKQRNSASSMLLDRCRRARGHSNRQAIRSIQPTSYTPDKSSYTYFAALLRAAHVLERSALLAASRDSLAAAGSELPGVHGAGTLPASSAVKSSPEKNV